MKKIALLICVFSAVSVFCSQSLSLRKQLSDVQFELYTYEKRAEHLQQIVDSSEAAHTVRMYWHLLPEKIARRPRKKMLQSKKRYLAEEKEYLATLERMQKELQEANLELSQMPEYQELQLAKAEIEKLKEKIQQILVLLQQFKG